jgi:hypothetical protein
MADTYILHMKQSMTLVVKMTPDLKEALMIAAEHSSTPWMKVSASEYARQAIIEKLTRDAKNGFPARSGL